MSKPGRTRVRWLGVTMTGLGLLGAAACGKHERTPSTPPATDDTPNAGAGAEPTVGGAGKAAIGQAGSSATAGKATTGGVGGMPPTNEAGVAGEAQVGNPIAPSYPGYTLVIDEHFDEPLDLNADPIWTWSDGGDRAGQVRYVEDAITFSDGVMKITTARPSEPVPVSHSFAENAEPTSMPFTSGELRTKHNNYRFGRYEARIKAPIPVPAARTAGNFITSFQTSRTPLQEEYRVLAFYLVGGRPNGLTTVMGFGPGIGSSETQGWGKQHELEPTFDTGTNFHTYALVWRSNSVSWYLDDQPMAIRDSPVDNPNGPPVSQLSAKIMLSTWIFNASYALGGLEGQANVYPFTTEVDFIRFYKEDSEQYPCEGPPECLPAEDLNASKNNPKETDTEG